MRRAQDRARRFFSFFSQFFQKNSLSFNLKIIFLNTQLKKLYQIAKRFFEPIYSNVFGLKNVCLDVKKNCSRCYTQKNFLKSSKAVYCYEVKKYFLD